MEEGYPRSISDFGLPMDGVDAVFVWLHNDKTYFFKDNHYWRYDDHLRNMDQGYPKDTTLWKGIPSQLDDAMRWSDGELCTCFSKACSQYDDINLHKKRIFVHLSLEPHMVYLIPLRTTERIHFETYVMDAVGFLNRFPERKVH